MGRRHCSCLDGEALNVALLMPEGERADWKGLSQGLSDYYNSPGRLAVFRRQLESATRRTGMDPATFATELEILAVRGFGDMGKCARNCMVRDKFITAQRRCGLRRHLDSVPPDTPIRDIVDRCRVWESHSERKTGSARAFRECPMTPGSLKFPDRNHSSQLVPVASVIQSDAVAHQKGGGGGSSQIAPLDIMSSLIAQLLRTAQEDYSAEVKVPPDAGARPPSIVSEVGSVGQNQSSEGEQVMVCFSCGRPGHGVNRCSRVDTSFPFLPQGWSVEVRDGQYRAV